MQTLELGGNAFGDAVAVGFVLQLAGPHFNGQLGEIPIIFHNVAERQISVVCGQGPAPATATIAHLKSLGIAQIPGSGLLAAAIPGAFDAWMLLLRDCGSLPLQTILSLAIKFADNGVPVIRRMSKAMNVMKAWFAAKWPANADIYLPGGKLAALGSMLCHPALAERWKRTLTEAQAASTDRVTQIDTARDIWRPDFLAEAIGQSCATASFRDASGQKNGGLITQADMGGWSARYEKPVSTTFRGYGVHKCGPWGEGPVLLQGLRLAEQMGVETLGGEVRSSIGLPRS